MDWNSVKWFAILVAAGVTTAVAVELVTKKMQDYAVLAARAEVQKLILAVQEEAKATAAAQIASKQAPDIPPIMNDPSGSFHGIMY